MNTETPQQLEEIQRLVREQTRVIVRAGGTKPPLHAGANLDLSQWTGVVEYDPSEYTFTARSGTRLAEIRDLLAGHDQFLPFDPIFVDRGGSLGGAVASGCAGSGRFRYGGIRDFLLGVHVVNADGELVRGGGKVVKNAAGFDIPKLMVGGLGRFGVMAELTFKVFPRPETAVTLELQTDSLSQALDQLTRIALSPAEVFCLDLIPPHRLLVRIAGWQEASLDHVARIRTLVSGESRLHEGEAEEEVWKDAREFTWQPENSSLVRVPLLPSQIPTSEALLNALGDASSLARRYTVGGNLLWVCWPADRPWSDLEKFLQELGRPGQVVTGSIPQAEIGLIRSQVFAKRLRGVFDPRGKFQSEQPANS